MRPRHSSRDIGYCAEPVKTWTSNTSRTRIMGRYSKTFLAIAVPLAVLGGMIGSVLFGVPMGLVYGVASGLLYGGSMSLVFGLLHGRSVKRITSDESQEAMGVHHVRSVELQLPYDKVFDLCLESLGQINKCGIRNENRSQGIIMAKSGVSWKSWGEAISFQINEAGDDGTQVEISSRPVLRTTLVDCGKNLENVIKITGFLSTHNESSA